MTNIDPAKALYDLAQEYQDFAYIISHDMNAPLRHVKEFTRLLIQSRNQAPTPEEAEYIKYLENSLIKLERMQEALLNFSRLNSRAGAHKETDCNILIRQILDKLQVQNKLRNTHISCEDMPKIFSEPQQMQLLFTHLIDNALKFHKPDATRTLAITVQEQKNNFLITITDNGIGIPIGHQESVFNLFRRLHTEEQYPGIGAGLAIARKIVQRHNGDIWIESKGDDQGTSVCFTMPKDSY